MLPLAERVQRLNEALHFAKIYDAGSSQTALREDLRAVVLQVNPQPWGKKIRLCPDLRQKISHRDPCQIHHFLGFRGGRDMGINMGDENIDDFMLDKATADIGAVFDLITVNQV
jgi:hypothetical protein